MKLLLLYALNIREFFDKFKTLNFSVWLKRTYNRKKIVFEINVILASFKKTSTPFPTKELIPPSPLKTLIVHRHQCGRGASADEVLAAGGLLGQCMRSRDLRLTPECVAGGGEAPLTLDRHHFHSSFLPLSVTHLLDDQRQHRHDRSHFWFASPSSLTSFFSFFFSIIFLFPSMCSPRWRESCQSSQCFQGLSIPVVRKNQFGGVLFKYGSNPI